MLFFSASLCVLGGFPNRPDNNKKSHKPGEKMIKKTIMALFLIAVLLMQVTAVSAMTASDAKQDWRDAKKVSAQKQEIHRDAKITFAGDASEENKQAVVDTGKDVLDAALDEAEAWLLWKDLETEENPDIPDDLKETIHEDVETNLAKIDELRSDVDGISNRLELGIVYLKMVGSYIELVTDVARDSGMVYVHLANTHIEKAEDLESRLREEAEDMNDNGDIIEKLETARDDIDEAKSNVDKAKSSYEQVVLPGSPLIKFSEGNNYLRVARTNLLSAHRNLNQAYILMVRGE